MIDAGDTMSVAVVQTFPGEYATTIADITLALITDAIGNEICNNCGATILNGDDRFDTFTYSFMDGEINTSIGVVGHLGVMTFGPNTKILVQVTQNENNGNAGDMDAIVTFFVEGPDEDDVDVTVFEDQATLNP